MNNKMKENNNEQIEDYLQKRILELQSIRDQYSGAIEAYKDVLNKIQEQEQNESDNEKSETSVDT